MSSPRINVPDHGGSLLEMTRPAEHSIGVTILCTGEVDCELSRCASESDAIYVVLAGEVLDPCYLFQCSLWCVPASAIGKKHFWLGIIDFDMHFFELVAEPCESLLVVVLEVQLKFSVNSLSRRVLVIFLMLDMASLQAIKLKAVSFTLFSAKRECAKGLGLT